MSKKSGMTHVSERNVDTSADFGYAEKSILDLDPAIVKHFEGKNLALRWINGSKYTKSGGFHQHGWQPVRVADIPKEVMERASLGFGVGGDGYIVRNDSMLAVRPKERQEQHKSMLKRRADAQSGRESENAERLREHFGGKAKVFEGYEDND
jgi:hypothetical protein